MYIYIYTYVYIYIYIYICIYIYIRRANGPFGVLDPGQRVEISATILIYVSNTVYNICIGAQNHREW